jgi:hypothetical protein
MYVAFRHQPDLVGRTGITHIPASKRLRTRLRGAVLPVARAVGARRLIEKYWRAVLDEELVRGYRQAMARDPEGGAHDGRTAGQRTAGRRLAGG